MGIPRSTVYAWYDRNLKEGSYALEDDKPRPKRVWNKIPDEVGQAIVELVLEVPELSPRELAVTFTDTKRSFVSEASVYRRLEARNLHGKISAKKWAGAMRPAASLPARRAGDAVAWAVLESPATASVAHPTR